MLFLIKLSELNFKHDYGEKTDVNNSTLNGILKSYKIDFFAIFGNFKGV